MLLDKVNITVNKNTIPGEKLSPSLTSGIRIGSPAMTTRGLKEKDFVKIGLFISKALKNKDNETILKSIKKEVIELTSKFPLYK